jgi:excisionase family DNA binding protein
LKGPLNVTELKQSKSDLTTEYRPHASQGGPNSGSAASAPMPRLLTTEDVAEMTGLSPETLAQWRWLKKEIPFVRLGKKCVRYRQSDIDAWLSKRLVSVTSGENPERR